MSVEVEKFLSRKSLKEFTPEEQLLEINNQKEQFNIELFKEDIDFSKEYKVNISRLARHLIHAWLVENREGILTRAKYPLL